jgi:hypothetical protein
VSTKPGQLHFLGFAFDEQNINILKLNRINDQMTLYATRYKMTRCRVAACRDFSGASAV